MATIQPEGVYTNSNQQLPIIPVITGGSEDGNSIDGLQDNLNSEYYGCNIEVESSSFKSSSSSDGIKGGTRTRQGGRSCGNHADARRYHTTGVIEDIKVVRSIH